MPSLLKQSGSLPFARSLLVFAGGAVSLLAGAAPALAQNALGDGRALDANPLVGSGGRNQPGRDIAAEVRFRNAIVTGNVAGGFSFRGDVGYRAADDFRGALGSEEIYPFLRDTLYSAPSTTLRGVDALRYQMRFSTGGQVDELYGVPILRRPGAGQVSGFVRPGQPAQTIPGTIAPELSIDTAGLQPGSMRSTGDYLASRSLSLRVLGEGQLEDGRSVFSVASPLMGVTMQTRFDYARPVSPNMIRGEASDGRIDAMVPNAAAESGRIESGRVSYERVLEELRRVAEAMAPEEIVDGAPEVEVEAPMLPGMPQAPAAPAPPGGRPAAPASPTTPFPTSPDGGAARPAGGVPQAAFQQRIDSLMQQLQIRQVTPGGTGAPEAPKSPEESRKAMLAEATALLSGPAIEVNSLLPAAPESRDLFTEHLRRAEELLRADQWFDAEERFSAALTLRPGEPMAAAGRVNAQIGASLFLSASVNLHHLLRTYPELINVRYSPDLLPEGERLQAVRTKLREMMSGGTDPARGAAMLFAYLGHQTGSVEDVREGFAAIDRIDEKLGQTPDPLHEVARAVWLDAEAPSK